MKEYKVGDKVKLKIYDKFFREGSPGIANKMLCYFDTIVEIERFSKDNKSIFLAKNTYFWFHTNWIDYKEFKLPDELFKM